MYQYQHTTPLVSVPSSCTDGCTYSREGDRETYCFLETGEYRVECEGGEQEQGEFVELNPYVSKYNYINLQTGTSMQ